MVASHLKTVEAYGALWHHCPACDRYLRREDFAKSKNRPYGLHANCLECNRRKQAADRARRGEEYREMRRRYRASDNGRAAYRKYRTTHTRKVFAHNAVQHAVSAGKIQRPDKCEQCERGGIIDAHHDDYAKIFEVRWLCRWCHQAWHREHGEALNAN